jgi:5-methylcytosine-specific restriction endonuclease McrA
MQLITRADAKTAGLKRYFTGESCSSGHVAERRVSDHGCVECSRVKAASPEERERRREYMRDHMRRYRKKRPDRIRATNDKRKAAQAANARKRRAKNPEPTRLALRKSFQKHKAKRMAETKAWHKKNKAKMALYMRPIKVMRRAAEGRFDSDDIVRMLVMQNNTCAACSADISSKYHVDHIVPITRGGTHWPSNLQLLCRPCNQSKGNKTMSEWTAWKVEMGYLSDLRDGTGSGSGIQAVPGVSGTLLT